MSHRFMYQNRLSSSVTITPRSMAQGVVGGAVPRVANGSGGVIFTGPYTGDGQRVYTVEIDLAGEVGVATFKWRTTDTAAGSWEASGVLTSLTDVTLSAGVKARFTAGAGTDFPLGDRWEATASNRFGKRFLYDLDPNQRFRTGTPGDPETIAFGLLTAQEVKAAVLHLHNISSGATVKLQGGPVAPQAGVTTDGTGWIDVPVAGFGTLVGAGNDWAFGFTIKTPSDLTGTQRVCTDHSAGGASQVIEVNMGPTLGVIVNNEISQSFAVSASTVYRVLISFLASDKKFRLYKDGALQATSGAMAATIGAGSDFAFMRAGGFNGQYLKSGAILGNVIIYGEYLDATEALAEFNGTFTAGAALKGKWLMDEGSGAAVADTSGLGNNGTLTGGASWSDALAMVDETIAWRAGTMFRYLATASKTWRHWRLRIGGDSANPDGRIEIGELYLGDYFEPGEDFSWNSVPGGEEAVERRQETESGTPRDVLLNRLRSARLGYEHLAAADVASFRAMFQAVKDAANGRNLPLFAHLDVDDGGESLKLYRLGASLAPVVEGPDDHALEIELLERGT